MDIALDMEFIRLMKTGKPLYMRITDPGKFKVGDIVGVKETYKYEKNDVAYIAETPLVDPIGWCYSNSMPKELVKRHVIVRNVTEYSAEEYDSLFFAYKETTYNRIPFYIDDIGYTRPLRNGGQAKPPSSKFCIVKFKAHDGFEDVYAKY